MITNKNTIFAVFVLVLALISCVSSYAAEQKSYFAASRDKGKKDAVIKKPIDASLTQDLVYRAAFGRADDVKLLLDKGADPEAKNAAGLPVLLIATIRKDDEGPKIVEALIKGGSNVNKIAIDGNMAVLEAVRGGRPDVLQILIDNRAVLGAVRDHEGNDLLTIAETRGNLQIVKILNAGLENEKDKVESLKSQDNFIKLVQQYSFLSCASEYLNFYISTQPKGINMVAFNNVITANSAEIDDTAIRIKMLFRMTDPELRSIQISSRGEIITQLRFYETNENRELNGIGTDEDLNNRCQKIAGKWNASKMDMQQYRQNTK